MRQTNSSIIGSCRYYHAWCGRQIQASLIPVGTNTLVAADKSKQRWNLSVRQAINWAPEDGHPWNPFCKLFYMWNHVVDTDLEALIQKKLQFPDCRHTFVSYLILRKVTTERRMSQQSITKSKNHCKRTKIVLQWENRAHPTWFRQTSSTMTGLPGILII